MLSQAQPYKLKVPFLRNGKSSPVLATQRQNKSECIYTCENIHVSLTESKMSHTSFEHMQTTKAVPETVRWWPGQWGCV